MKKRYRDKDTRLKIKGENNTGEIKTKPNGAQSVRDILFRNTQGMAYDNYKTPFYEEQASFSSQSMNIIQDMELTEKLQFLKEQKIRIESLTNSVQDYQNQLLEEQQKFNLTKEREQPSAE